MHAGGGGVLGKWRKIKVAVPSLKEKKRCNNTNTLTHTKYLVTT